jgi:hypothetical protein
MHNFTFSSVFAAVGSEATIIRLLAPFLRPGAKVLRGATPSSLEAQRRRQRIATIQTRIGKSSAREFYDKSSSAGPTFELAAQ